MDSPGPTESERFGRRKTDQDRQQIAQMAAVGRPGQPGDIAGVVASLASDDARRITRSNGRLI